MSIRRNSKQITNPDDPFSRLKELVDKLRSKEGCPWDRKQTASSMAPYMVEEAYELLDAVSADDPAHACEELGDVLFHIVFITRIFEEKGQFGLNDVIRGICGKMIKRHPHVYGDKKINSSGQVRQQWETIKASEKKGDQKASILDTIPKDIPGLLRAYRLSSRAGRAGFDWDTLSGVIEKVEEEWTELKEAMADTDPENEKNRRIQMELGDLLFTLVNVARFAGFHPETAMTASNRKFERRFRRLEAMARKNNTTVKETSKNILNKWWDQIKKDGA